MSSIRKSATSPASRARCLVGFSFARPPVDRLFRPAPCWDWAYPPLSGAPAHLTVGPVWYGVRPMSPRVARSRARGTLATSAAAVWVCVLHPCAATAPDPHVTTPHEAPLVDRGGLHYPAGFWGGDYFFWCGVATRVPHVPSPRLREGARSGGDSRARRERELDCAAKKEPSPRRFAATLSRKRERGKAGSIMTETRGLIRPAHDLSYSSRIESLM